MAKTAPAPHRALYRKYRPTKLEDVVGQEQVTKTLLNALKQDKIGHAYLFIGPRGTGKTSVARIFAHAINHFDYNIEDSYLDIVEIDAASNTGVDNIRELREKAIIAPSQGKYKVYIIDEIHMLSKSAANALLKTVEEPPEHVVFILATTEANKVPITISSRTQLFTFKLADDNVMLEHLRQISDLEKIPITDDALKIIVKKGGGSFRDSLSLLDQVATLSDQEITADIITNALGLPQEQAINALLAAFQNNDNTIIHDQLHNLLNAGLSPETIASELIQSILLHPHPSLMRLLEKLPDVQPPFSDAKLLLALFNFNQSPAPALDASLSKPTATPPKPSSLSQKPSKTTPQPKLTSPEPTSPKSTPSETQKIIAGNFEWKEFLNLIREQHELLFNELKKCQHEFSDNCLHIYPPTKFTHKLLQKPEHSQAIVQTLGEVQFTLHEFGESAAPKDATISQISAIMGNIQEIKGDTPF